MEKTIKYLEGGEYHYATVRSVGDLAQLKTNSKETLVEAINELWNGGGSGGDPTKAPKPEGYDQLVQDVADTVNNIQQINQAWVEWQKADQAIQEERKQDYLKALKEMNEAVEKAKSDAAALKDRTDKLDEEITKTFSELDTSVRNMHERLNAENERLSRSIEDTKSELESTKKDLQNAQLDNGKIHNEVQNLEDKFNRKIWNTDLDPLKEQINHNSTEVQQTKNELLEKADRKSFDTLTGTVENLNTQVKKTAEGVELSVKKAELGGEIAEALTNKSNILQGTRRFTTNKWLHTENVTFMSDSWKGFKVAKQTQPMEGITQAIDVKAGITYTFSLYAWIKGEFGEFLPILVLYNDGNDYELVNKLDNIKKDLLDITDEPRRYSLTFTPSEDCTIYPQVISYNINEGNYIGVCGFQLEIGKDITPWEPNQEDIGDYVEKSEAQFNVYNDKIQAITEKQRQQGETQEQLRTQVTQTAEGTKQVSEQLKSTNGDVEKLRGQIDATASHLKTEYEEYTNKAVGQISDSTLNLIRNSSFMNRDDNFSQWQNISAKANIREDENGLRWVEISQSGLNTNNPEGITSNYFKVSQGKVTIAVDIKAGASTMLDNEEVLSLEVYNDSKKRVDFYGVTLTQMGLSETLLNDHQVHRGLYRLGIDRQDATYMTVKAKLVRNGDLYFTNFSARLSSIDDGAYEPNPDDLNQQILKQNTKIEQGAKEIALRAKSADVTREIQGVKGELSDDIKSAKDAAIKVASDQVNISVNELSTSFDDKLNKRTNEIKTAYEKFTSDGIEQTVHKITDIKGDVDRLGDKVNNIKVGGRNLALNTSQDIVIDDTANTGTQGWRFEIINLTQQPKIGDQITVSAEGTLTGKGDLSKYHVVLYNQTTTNQRSDAAQLTSGKRDHATLKLTNQLGDGDTVLLIYAGLPEHTAGKKNIVHHLKVEFGNIATDWTAAPEDIDKKIDLQTLESANIDDLKTAGHYFIHNLNGNPIGGWVYVDVVGDNAGRIRQDVYQDSGIHHKYRRWFGDHWTGWEESASQSDLNNIKTEVTASVKNLGDRVTTEVTGLTTKIDNINVGGRNYISPNKISKYYQDNLTYDSAKQEWTTQIPNGCGGSWGAGIQFLQTNMIVPWGQAYTDSIEVYVTDSGLKHQIDINNYGYEKSLPGNDNDNRQLIALNPAPGTVIPTNQWYKLSMTAWNSKPSNTEHISLWDGSGFGIINNTGHTITVRFRKPKQELGTKATDWSPNPDDTAQVIKELNTKWDVANGQIQGKVTETQVNNILNGKGYATQSWAQGQFRLKSDSIDLEVKKITDPIQNQVNSAYDRLNNMKVGGRNLLRWTSDKMVNLNGGGWFDGYTTENKYTSVADYHNGDKFTYSMMVTNNSDENLVLEVWNCNGSKGRIGGAHASAIIPPGAQKMRVNVVAIIDGNTWYVEHHIVTTRDIGGKNITVGLQAEKFEVGDIATSWSPAPEDSLEGGINLYHNSADWANDWFNSSNWDNDNWVDSNGNPARRHQNHAWNGIGQTKWVPRGIYTYSCQMWLNGLSGNDNCRIYCGDAQYNGTAKTLDVSVPVYGTGQQNYWINYIAIIFVTQAGNLSIRPEMNNSHGTVHIGSPKLEKGANFTSYTHNFKDDVTTGNVISKINISPEKIRLLSNKIEIDGNTYIHGTLNVPEVKLQGKSGVIDLSGEEINIAKTNGSGVKVAANGIQLTANTNGQQEIEGVLTTAWSMNNKNQNGIGLVITPEQTLGRPYGGDILTIGEMPAPGVIHAAMVFDATGINPDYKRGFNWFAPHTLNGDGGILRFPGAQDDLLIYPGNIPGSRQSGFSQPTMTLINGSARGSAGIQFQWNDLVPFGRVETSHTYFSPVGARADSGLGIGWVHWSDWGWDGNVPMIHRRDANGGVNAGFAFFSSGDTVWWKGGYRSNLIGSLRQTDGDNTPQIGGF